MWKTPIGRVRAAGMLEGTSFLLLLGVAMPLKYFADLPLAVTYTGWVHGVLFIGFCVTLGQAMSAVPWGITRGLLVFCAALVPFGPFVIDRGLARQDAERGGG